MCNSVETRAPLHVTESGGCALDIDTEEEYDAVCARYDDWLRQQEARSARLFGALPERVAARREGSLS